MNRRLNGSAAAFAVTLLTQSPLFAQDDAREDAVANPSSETVAEAAQAPDPNVRAGQKDEDDDVLMTELHRPGGLTSDDAARQAADYSQDARVAREDYKYALARKRETIYNYVPRLTLTASYTRQSVPGIYKNRSTGSLVGTTADAGPLTPADPLYAIDGSAFNFSPLANNWYLNAGLVVPISDYVLNFSQAISGANSATKAAQLNEQAAQLNAAANARLSYYEWVRARLRVNEVNKALQRAQAQLENLQLLEGGGRVGRVDVLRQEAFVSSTELDVRRARTNEMISRQGLHQAMTGGEGELPNWEVGEDIMALRPGDDAQLGDLKNLEKEAISKRLEMQALEERASALDDQSSVYRTRGYPRVEAFGNLTYANPNARYIPPTNEWNGSWDVGVRAVWTVNDLGVNQSAAQASDSEAEKVRAQRQQAIDALRSEVLSSYQIVEEARLAKVSAKRGVLAAEAAHRDRLQLFDNGRSTTLDVLQAETSLVTARMNLIDAHIILREAQVRLEHALGRDVKDVAAR